MEEKYYAGFDLDQIREVYPKLSPVRLKQFAEVYDKCCEAFGINGNLFEIKLRDGTFKTGVVRQMNWVMLGAEEIYLDIEPRNIDQLSDRFFRGDTQRIMLLDIKEIKLLKQGNEKLSDKEIEFIDNSIRQGLTEYAIEKKLNAGI